MSVSFASRPVWVFTVSACSPGPLYESFAATGGSLTATTANATVLWMVTNPSLTEMSMEAGPNALGNDVTWTVRFAPLPPTTSPLFPMMDVVSDDAATVRASAAVSASPTVNEIGQLWASSFMAGALTFEMVGAVLASSSYAPMSQKA